MAFVVELDQADTEALRALAQHERRSVHDVVVPTVQERLERARRDALLDRLVDDIAAEDAELLERLAR